MRKLLMGAVVASATPRCGRRCRRPDARVDIQRPPSRRRRPARPTKPEEHDAQLRPSTLDKPGTTVEFIDLELPKGLKISGKGLEQVHGRHARARSVRLPASSKAGPTGSATR